MLLYVVGEMAVTRRFDTEFYAPVLLGVPYEVSAGAGVQDRPETRSPDRIARGDYRVS